MPQMADETAVAQARELLKALHEHVAEISQKLDAEEKRASRAVARGVTYDHRRKAGLRRDLYEVHRLIDGLYRRFPQTRQAEHELKEPVRRIAQE
jgi:hypothetical protein